MPSRLGTGILITFFGTAVFALAQVPHVPGVPPGRSLEGNTLTFCVDKRNPTYKVDQAIAIEIAQALLLEPRFYTIQRTTVTDEFDNVFLDLREFCDAFLGFKLIPTLYPNWIITTRAYYQARYVVVVKQAGWTSLADIPKREAISSVPGNIGDLRLIQYLNTLVPEQRWPRFPMADTRAALNSLLEGTVAAALVWEPSFWELRLRDPDYRDLYVITPEQISEPAIGVGAILMFDNTFARTTIDEAITALAEDGIIEETLLSFDFPADAPR